MALLRVLKGNSLYTRHCIGDTTMFCQIYHELVCPALLSQQTTALDTTMNTSSEEYLSPAASTNTRCYMPGAESQPVIVICLVLGISQLLLYAWCWESASCCYMPGAGNQPIVVICLVLGVSQLYPVVNETIG